MDNRIETNTCDSCQTSSTGVLFHHNGAPVLFMCRSCDPANYEFQARLQIDAWLAGGVATGTGVYPAEYV
jgi:hypothetical protein